MPDENQKFVYSVLILLYRKDSPEYFKIAIDSMINQTIPPEEILVAVDGPIGDELRGILDDYKERYGNMFTIQYYKENRGQGSTLRDALPLCRNEFIARMDSDDYSVPDRIEKEFAIFGKYPELSGVGSNVDEFDDDMSKPVARVIMPETPEEVLKFAKRRCPFRQSTFLVKKSAVMAAGNYRNVYRYEDYDLVARILMNMRDGSGGIYNIQEVLTYMRVSKDYYRRRRGLRLARSAISMRFGFWRKGFISFTDFFISGFGQAFVAIMPAWFSEWFYNKFLRN